MILPKLRLRGEFYQQAEIMSLTWVITNYYCNCNMSHSMKTTLWLSKMCSYSSFLFLGSCSTCSVLHLERTNVGWSHACVDMYVGVMVVSCVCRYHACVCVMHLTVSCLCQHHACGNYRAFGGSVVEPKLFDSAPAPTFKKFWLRSQLRLQH